MEEQGGEALRIAVKDPDAQASIVEILAAVFADHRPAADVAIPEWDFERK